MNVVATVRNRITTPADHVCMKFFALEYRILSRSFLYCGV
jgi:hypothetical protein